MIGIGGRALSNRTLNRENPEMGNFGAAIQPKLHPCDARSRLASAGQKPSHKFLVRIAPKFPRRIAPTAVELVFLGRRFGECCNLLLGLSLILWKGHPFANEFSARLVVFHVRGSFAHLIWDKMPAHRMLG